MFKLKNNLNFTTGKIIPLEKIRDEVFSKKMLGDGYAIMPSEGKIYSPVNGILSTLFPTGHAYGITTEDGVEILLHLGIDTVEIGTKAFTVEVKQGQKVKAGELLCIMNLELLTSKGYDCTCIFVVTSGEKVKLNYNTKNVKAKENNFYSILKND